MKIGEHFIIRAHFGEYDAICTQVKPSKNGLMEVRYDVPELNLTNCIIELDWEDEK